MRIDTILGNGKIKTLTGTDADSLVLGYGVSFDDGLLDNNSNFAETLNGRGGDDRLYGGGGDDILNGDAGDDLLAGGGGADRLAGGAGNDSLVGGAGRDNLVGDAGDDLLAGGAEADLLNGGDGVDTASYADSAAGVAVNLLTKSATGGDAAGDTLIGIENLVGSNYADTLTGTIQDNLLIGGGGADTLAGGAGVDTASYAASAAAVTVNLASNANSGGEAAGDKLSGVENLVGSGHDDHLTGDAGNNVINGGDGADAIDGGLGVDTASYATSGWGVIVDLATGETRFNDAEGDTLTNIENLTGSDYYDHLTGDAGNNVLSGGLSDDLLSGGAGADTLDGGAGHDTVDYSDSGAGVNLNLGTGAASGGDAKGDKLISIEGAVGSRFADTLTGDKNDNNFDGGAGADTIAGGAGIDSVSYDASPAGVTVNLKTGLGAGGDAAGDKLSGIENLSGSSYDDVLTGDAGDNWFYAGPGVDVMEGGAGADWLGGGGGDSIDTYDTVSYASSAAGVSVNLATGAASGGDAKGDHLFQIGNLIGSRNADSLTGDQYDNGLSGGAGNDTLEGGAGADRLTGGDGVDTASYAASLAGVSLDLAEHGGAGGDADGDTLAGIENLVGSSYADRLLGDAGANALSGGGGDDFLAGGLGADVLDGGAGLDTASYADSAAGVTLNLATNVYAGGAAAGDKLSNIENLIGSNFNDTLTGSGGDNLLAGGFGADTINGGNGSDTASYAGSAGGVTLNLATNVHSGGDAAGDRLSSIENLIGSAYDDSLTGGAGDNRIDGGEGDDLIDAGAGRNTVDGGDGDDRINVGAGFNTVHGGAGTDTLSFASSAAGIDAIQSGEQSQISLAGHSAGTFDSIEKLIGSAYDDTFYGNADDNTYSGGAGADFIYGAEGVDTADYAASAAGVAATLLASHVSHGGDAEGDQLIGIENLVGSSHDDILTGDAGNNLIDGGEGDDLIDAGAGYNTVDGGDGSDTLSFAASAVRASVYQFDYYGNTYLDGGATGQFYSIERLVGSDYGDDFHGDASDTTYIGGAGGDFIYGADGVDTADYAASAAGVTATLRWDEPNYGGDAEGDVLIAIENLTGSSHADSLTGNDDDNALSGGAGDDLLDGGYGADAIDGGDGVDTASYQSSWEGVTLNLATGDNSGGHADGDRLTGIENLTGSFYDDIISGDAGANVLDGSNGVDALAGGDGADTLIGGSGADLLDGGDGADTLIGGDGGDALIGGAGADTLDGGAGADTAYYGLSAAGVRINLTAHTSAGGDAAGDTLTGVENLTGSEYADILIGDAQDNRIEGGAGDDTIDIGTGYNNSVDGGDGSDTLTFAASASAVQVNLSIDSANPDAFGMVLYGVGPGQSFAGFFVSIENVVGSAYNDLINGDNRDNVIEGGAGADMLFAGDGVDTASYAGSAAGVTASLNIIEANSGGDAANDLLFGFENLIGSAFGDTLKADASFANALTGGGGADRFDFSALWFNDGASNFALIDTITDFASGVDQIAFSGGIFQAGASGGYVENLSAAASLSALGAAAAAAHDGGAEYYFGVYAGDGYLLADNEADGWSTVIKLTGVTDIAASDIVVTGPL